MHTHHHLHSHLFIDWACIMSSALSFCCSSFTSILIALLKPYKIFSRFPLLHKHTLNLMGPFLPRTPCLYFLLPRSQPLYIKKRNVPVHCRKRFAYLFISTTLFASLLLFLETSFPLCTMIAFNVASCHVMQTYFLDTAGP